MKRTLCMVMLACLMSFSLNAGAAVPKIDIAGLNGGSGWLWVEAEDATLSSGGHASYQSYGVSGYRDTQPHFDNATRQEGAPSIEWQAHIPTAMSANTKLLAFCGSHYGRDANVSVDGTQTDTMTLPVGEWGNLAGWAMGDLTAMSAGDHTLNITVPVYDMDGYDGVLIYDGDISVSGYPTVVQSNNYMFWMGANMTPNSRPVLSSGSVVPQFSVSGALGACYWINKDGQTSSYTPGTAITEPGNYRVWAEAWGSVNDGSPQQHTIAGVDFTLQTVPEPGSLLALAIGMPGMLMFCTRRKK